MYKKVSKEIILILLMAAYLIVPASKSVVQALVRTAESGYAVVLHIHNRERAAVGFPPLTWSNSLGAETQSWANHLSTLGVLCGPQGCKPSPLMIKINQKEKRNGIVSPLSVFAPKHAHQQLGS